MPQETTKKEGMLLVTIKKCKQTVDFTKKQSFKKVFSHRHNRGKRKYYYYYIQTTKNTATPISMILNLKNNNREAEK